MIGAAMAILLTALAASPWAAAPPPAPRSAPQPDEARLLDLVNRERRARHLEPLAWDPDLAALARLHAADMAAAGRISHHSTRDGADFTVRLSRTDYRAMAAAENVAMAADVPRAHDGLMNSPGHRANILSRELTAIGIGIVPGAPGAIFVVEDFAAPQERLTADEAAARLRAALRQVAGAARGRPLLEDAAIARRLQETVARMAADDSVRTAGDEGFAAGWIFTWTAADPSQLPRDARDRASRAEAFALALVFRKTRSYPFGVWWVALALKGSS